MMSRLATAAVAVAGLAAVGTASAASLVISATPTLATIVVEVSPCEDEATADVRVTWTNGRPCDTAVRDEPIEARSQEGSTDE